MRTIQSTAGRARAVLALSVFLAGLGACTGTDEPTRREMSFKVDGTLVAHHFEAPGFWVLVPKDWDHVSFDELSIERDKVHATADEYLAPEVAAFYRHAGDGATLAIHQYNPALARSEQWDVIQHEAGRLESSASNPQMRAAHFTYNGFAIDQYTLAGADQVTVSLFARSEGAEMYGMVFAVPRGEFAKHLPAIESCVGTLSPTPVRK